MSDAFDAAVGRHDREIAALGLEIWVGSEPTFTDRSAQTPEWLNQALGGDKEDRATAVLMALERRFRGSLVLRSVGRQYPGEPGPRWSLGLYRRRDGEPLWHGPPDPSLAGGATELGLDLDAWAGALHAALQARGWLAELWAGEDPRERRLLLRFTPEVTAPESGDPRLARASVHSRPIPPSGLRDELAEAGAHLFVLRSHDLRDRPLPRLELPAFGDVGSFLAVLGAVAEASLSAGLVALTLAGFPPPVDATVEWTTVTPDPAVIEINTAPSANGQDFLWRSRHIYAAAVEEGLAPFRLYFNGVVADSGGGGQITLGGPSPQDSPFLREPQLLPRLVCFFNRHPALSYLYAHDYIGSSGQSVRADERGRDAFAELDLTLALLAAPEGPSAAVLWHSLAPFLCDASGNSHRAEINIEKLFNPYLAHRGKLGLVEFRALRMQHTPERATALACLLRAVVAMLVRQDCPLPLVDWGRELHTRFSLPFYLEQDLRMVLEALASAGVGLDGAIRDCLLVDEFRYWGQVALPGCILEVRRALEFWPLLGDAASPEQGGGSRLVDASTSRVELRLRPDAGGEPDWLRWEVLAAGVPLPMRLERDGEGALRVFGLRYRSFVPGWGLHPTLGTQAPVRLLLRHVDRGLCYGVTLHEWRPTGGGYAGLPEDLEAAGQRRAERLTLETLPAVPTSAAVLPSKRAVDPFCLDLRWLAA